MCADGNDDDQDACCIVFWFFFFFFIVKFPEITFIRDRFLNSSGVIIVNTAIRMWFMQH